MLSLNIPLQNSLEDSEKHSYGPLVIGSFITTVYLLMRVHWRNAKLSRWLSPPLQPRFGTLRLLAFPQTKITFEREEISDHQWDSEITMGQLMENCVSPKVPTLKGTEASLSYVQCFLYFVSSSINVSVFHITWMDTFWRDLVYILRVKKNPMFF